MKLEWEVKNGNLEAKGPGDRFYKVHRADDGWVAERWIPDDSPQELCEGWRRRECGWSKIPSLQEALHLCDQDAGCLEAISRAALESAAGRPAKFPSAMDASTWASRCTAWFGAFKVPDLTEWFQAALSHGFREGQSSVYELVDKAQRRRGIFGQTSPSGLVWIMGQQMLLAHVGPIEYRVWWTPENNWHAERKWPGAGIGLDACQRGVCNITFEAAIDWCNQGGSAPEVSPPPSAQAPSPPSVEGPSGIQEQIENLAWGLRREAKGSAERDNELDRRLRELECKVPPLPPSAEKRLCDLEEQTALNDRNLDRADAAFVELRKELTQFVAAKVQAVEGRVFNLENPNGDTRWHGVQKRLGDLETKLEDTHANLKVVQAVGERTEGDLDLLSRERAQVNHGLDCAEKRISALEAGPFPPERLRHMDRRISELEGWLGTKKLAPERNFAFETWSRIGKIEARLKTLEPDVPACEE